VGQETEIEEIMVYGTRPSGMSWEDREIYRLMHGAKQTIAAYNQAAVEHYLGGGRKFKKAEDKKNDPCPNSKAAKSREYDKLLDAVGVQLDVVSREVRDLRGMSMKNGNRDKPIGSYIFHKDVSGFFETKNMKFIPSVTSIRVYKARLLGGYDDAFSNVERGSSAAVIGLTEGYGQIYKTNSISFFNSLSRQLRAPVFVKYHRGHVYRFDGKKGKFIRCE
jgi:hypothetical protein